MIVSKVKRKAQVTIPQQVREHLGLQVGDLLGFCIEVDKVVLTRVACADDPVASFSEWNSDADCRAYSGL